MSKGTVKFFNDTKGFGFIVEDETNKEHFVHISGLIDEIREGDVVATIRWNRGRISIKYYSSIVIGLLKFLISRL